MSFTHGLRFTKDKNEIKDYRADLGYFDLTTNTEIFSAMTTINDHQDEVTDRNWRIRFWDLQELFNFDYAHRGRTRTLGVDASYRF